MWQKIVLIVKMIADWLYSLWFQLFPPKDGS